MGWNVLAEDERGLALRNHARDVRPQMPLIRFASTSSGDGKGLTGIARSDDIHDSTPRACVEGSEVVPDRSLVQRAVLHTRDQRRGCKGFPLHVADGPIGLAEREPEGEIESADAGA